MKEEKTIMKLMNRRILGALACVGALAALTATADEMEIREEHGP